MSSKNNRNERRREQTRAALVDAARELILETGPQRISIQDITDRADTGLGTFYNYFPAKEDVFEAVVSSFKDEFQDRLREARLPVKDPATLIAVTLRFCCEEALGNEDWNRFLKYCGLQGKQFLLPSPEQFFEDLDRGCRSGRFRIDNVSFTQSVITAMVTHVIREMHSGKMGRTAIEEVGRLTLRLLGLPDVAARAITQGPMPPVSAPRRHDRDQKKSLRSA